MLVPGAAAYFKTKLNGVKQLYHTVLFDEKQDFRRLDICEPCWQAQYSQGASERKGFVSYWDGVYQGPPAAAPEAIQKEISSTLSRAVPV